METILYIGLGQFLFAALLIFTKPRRGLADTTLGLWLLLMCLFMGLTLAKNGSPDSFWGRLQLFPFFFTIGPFLLFYVRFLTGGKNQFQFEDGLHILPFAVFSAVAVTQSHPVDEDIVAANLLNTSMLVYVIAALTSFVYYLTASFLALKRHQRNLRDYFSYTSARINLRWVQLVTAILSLTLILTMASFPINMVQANPLINPGIPLFLGLTLFGYGVSFFAIRQPEIFTNRPPSVDDRFVDNLEEPHPSSPLPSPGNPPDPQDGERENDTPKPRKYSHSGLKTGQAEEYLQRLLDYLDIEKPYLRRDLTLQDIAQELHIPPHHLTQTINESLDKNFYTLVNEYRVEEVKTRLLDPQYRHLTVLAIAHDAGFNSKSAFNLTFKKHEGLTPSQYRKQHLS